jgi:hypothetical protein
MQGALPAGTASVTFAGGMMALAGLLAAEPRVTLEVWHKERCGLSSWLHVGHPTCTLMQRSEGLNHAHWHSCH